MRRTESDRPLLRGILVTAAVLLDASLAVAVPWPGGSETEIPITGATIDLSGATWNPVSQSLWVVKQTRQLWEYGYDLDTGSFVLLRTMVLPGGIGIGGDIEACAQVDHSAADEIYLLSETQGRIARVADISGTPTVLAAWNLEVTNNGHALPPETPAGIGAEGLEFAPDAQLLAAGFRFPDGSAFTGSTKGMGGLMFVGHQFEGRLHVFDLNPVASDDFINHGSFLTSADETAGLHFDRTSGKMFVWHNPSDVNSLEISMLSSNASVGKIDTLKLFDSAMPSGNIEGIAVVDQAECSQFGAAEFDRLLFLTRDAQSPNLVYFAEFPCRGDGKSVPALSAWGCLGVALLLLWVSGLHRRRASVDPS
jgi:hypothetical protein